MTKMKKYILFITLLSLSSFIFGQGEGAVVDHASMELNFAKSLWFNSSNTAGLAITPLNDYSVVSARYSLNNGDFKLQQQGDKETDLSFNTNGALQLDNTYLWGDFSFSNSFFTGTKYNTNLFDPNYYMPYYISDPNSSNWNRQVYDMALKASTQLGDRFLLGIHVNYINKKGAKQKDPRSVPYNYAIFVQPSLAILLSKEHSIGLSLSYSNSYDRAGTSNSDSQNDQPVFVMKGLGHFSSGMVGGVGGLNPFYYKGNLLGGAIQYGYSGDFGLLLDIDYRYQVIDVFQTPTKPRRMGTTINNTIDADLQLLFPGETTHKVSANYYRRDVDGVEFIQEEDRTEVVATWKTVAKFIRSNYFYQNIQLGYDLFLGAADSYDWRLGIMANYSDRSDIYYMPESTLDTRNIFGELYAKKNFKFNDNGALLLGVNFGYNNNLDGSYKYGGPDKESLVITDFYAKDIKYLTSNYMKFGVDIDFSYKVGKKSSILVGLDYQMFSAQDLGSRNFLTATLGLLF